MPFVRTLLVLVAVLQITGKASSQSVVDIDAIGRAVAGASDAAILTRHQIHQNPELGNREIKTAALIASNLRALGLEVRTGVAHTGVIGILKGGRPGAVVALRADMDALPITEDTALPFKSAVRTTYNGQDVGVAHACGHDIHVSVMLGVASVLAPLRETFSGTVMFIFQPAEEGAPAGEQGGARLMLAEGAFKDVRPDAVFGLHSVADMPVGTIAYSSGPTNATSSSFKATLVGKSAHAAAPHLSVDPVLMAAQAVVAIQAIRARNLSPFEPSVITVSQIHGGVRNNIIPDAVHFEGTVRTFSDQVQDEVERRMREILDGVARGAGGSYELEYTRGTPVNVSNPDLVQRMLPTLQRAVGPDRVTQRSPGMAADDFAEFAKVVPGMFIRLGVLKAGTVSGGVHTATFLGDDAAIPVGMGVMSAMALDFLHR